MIFPATVRLPALTLGLCLLTGLPPALAQPAGVLVGLVRDSSGAAVAAADVLVRHGASGETRSTTTDASGRFELAGLAAGRHFVTVSAHAFSDEMRAVQMTAGERATMAFTLAPGALTESVTVTATRNELPTSRSPAPVSVVGREQLERRTLATVGDLFRALPGAQAVNEGPFQVRPRIRGLDSNRVLVLVDGQRLNNTRTSTSNSGIEIGLIDVEAIERVEVVRGGGSVLYGTDAMAGTVNLVTRATPPRQPNGFRFGGGLSGMFTSNEDGGRGSAFVEGAGRHVAFRVAQTIERFGDYRAGARDGESAIVPNSGADALATHAALRWFLDQRQTLTATYDARRASDIGVPGTGDVFTAYFPFSDRDYASVNYEAQQVAGRLARLTATAYYQRQRRNFTNEISVPAQPPAFPGSYQFSETVTDVATVGADVQSNWVLGASHMVTAGASFFHDRNGDSRYIERLSPDFSRFPPGLARSEDRSQSVPDASFGNIALFAQDELQFGPNVSATLGVRLDRFEAQADPTSEYALAPLSPADSAHLGLAALPNGLDVGRFAVTGDAGVLVQVAPALTVTSRLSRSFREPNLFERFFTDFGSVGGFVVGNPGLDPETGLTLDLGMRLSLGGATASATYFNSTYRDLLTTRAALRPDGTPIVIPRGPGQAPIPVSQTVNADRARIQGVELEADWPFAVLRGVLTPFGWATLLRGDDLRRNEPLDAITPATVFAGVRWESTGRRVWGEYGVRSVAGTDRLPAAALAARGPEAAFVAQDLRGGFQIGRAPSRTSIVIAVSNLTNRYYEEPFATAPARGRSALVSLNLSFF